MFGRKAMFPPLGLLTVAALLPQHWEFTLVDRNVRDLTEDEWARADLVMLSAMIVHKSDMLAQIREAKKRGKPVVVGGPYPTSLPDELSAAGADYLVLDEGEVTIPMFLAALERGDPGGVFRSGGEKPDVTLTPIPRFDLLERDAYEMMSVQYSRGCPFLCEFCDIITLYGRRPRTKTSSQVIAELERLQELGLQQTVFLVDDNFIGNKRSVKELLRELKVWLVSKNHPVRFFTEASVDLAQDDELLELMAQAGFFAVFLGIETPDEDSLRLTRKSQNVRGPLSGAVDKITRAGLRVMAGFIIGFDNEKAGAGERITRFVEETGIPMAMFSMLQALPHTGLWKRLEAENRLRDAAANINQTTLLNFVPTRPLEEIAREYVEGFWRLYEPAAYLDRVTRYCLMLGPPRNRIERQTERLPILLRGLLRLCWQQGVVRPTRGRFWGHLLRIVRRNPGVLGQFLAMCSHLEDFDTYRRLVRDEITSQLRAVESTALTAVADRVRIPIKIQPVRQTQHV